jgi:transposase
MEGCDRLQMRMACLDDMVHEQSMARVIDGFVDSLDLRALGFTNTEPAAMGRSSYSPFHMAKLYLLGYECGVRSSRRLEKACNTDLEFIWLMEGLAPDFKTIADFRRDNRVAFRALFKELTSFLSMMGLYGKSVCAIDGTKIKASNSRKRHVTKGRLEKAIEHHERRVEEYLSQLEEADGAEDVEETLEKAQRHTEKAAEHRETLERMAECGTDAVALTDPDCAMMAANNNGLDLAYNVQASVDSRAHLVAAFSATSAPTDYGQLSQMAAMTGEAMGRGGLLVLADKGYCSGADLAVCEDMDMDFIVACPDPPSYKGRDPAFAAERFIWDEDSDSYTCPGGQRLSCRSRKGTENRSYHAGSACGACPHREACVPECFCQ